MLFQWRNGDINGDRNGNTKGSNRNQSETVEEPAIRDMNYVFHMVKLRSK